MSTWKINPTTGDYVMTKGAPTDETSLIYPGYYRLKVRRTQWMYAPNSQYGSDFYTVKKRYLTANVNPLPNMAERALQPMIDDGRASDVSVTMLPPAGRNDVQMGVTLVDAQGTPQSLNLPVIGG